MRKLLGAVFAAAIILGMVAVSPALAQPPVDEVATAFEEILGFLGIALPAEAAILYGLAVFITYGWAVFGLLLGSFYTWAPIIGLLLIFFVNLSIVLSQYIVILDNAILMIPLAIAGPLKPIAAIVNAIMAIFSTSISPWILLGGHFLIDFAAALEPLKEYFPPPF
jgi:hypothetical protein